MEDYEKKLKIFCEHFAYNPLVLRDGNVHKISFSDLTHLNWDTKLILYPNKDNMCPGLLDEATGFIESLKIQHIDFNGAINSGFALPVTYFDKDPYEN